MGSGRVPQKGEIWHVNGDPVEGREFKGLHYYLVISQCELVAALDASLSTRSKRRRRVTFAGRDCVPRRQ